MHLKLLQTTVLSETVSLVRVVEYMDCTCVTAWIRDTSEECFASSKHTELGVHEANSLKLGT